MALIAAILDEAGALADASYLLNFAREHDLKITTIHDLIAHRRRTEN